MDKKKLKKLNSKIINSVTPFANISYKKKKEINIFVGRENSLKSLTESLYNSIYGDRSYGISISGPGGCGKSTLFGYFTQLINSQKLFDESYCRLKKNECDIITCFIDAPKGEPTTLKYFWTSIIDSLAEERIEFLEKFASMLFKKCLDVLWKNNFQKEKLVIILTKIIPTFKESIKHHDIKDLVDIQKFFEIIIAEEDLLNSIRNIIMAGWRILQRHEISFGLTGKTGFYDQRRTFKVEKQYFDLFFDMLSPDIDKSQQAQNIIKGVEGGLIKSDSDVINIFNWLLNTWEWIEEKPISFLIGVDNIGYLTVGLENRESAYIPFVQTILQMRESLKKFLFVLIGTNEDWRLFNEYIDQHKDYRTQLRGFLINKIDLTRLKLQEVIEALSLIMNRFWSQAGVIHPQNPLYPFSKEFFRYLYDYHAHEYREILINLDKIWSSYKSSVKVFELVEPFFMIKYIRIMSNEITPAPLTGREYQFSELFFSNLIEWEKEIVKTKFESIQSRHVGSTQSDLVERTLAESLRILQEKESPKQIDWAEKTPAISIETESGRKTRYPDVYVKLTRKSLSDRQRAFEIQVKMYDQNKFVKLKKIQSSLELLERAYTDALLFVMTGAGLEDKAIEEINKKNLSERILYYRSLDEEQFKALAYLVYYEDITGRKPSVLVIKEILEILFEIQWDQTLENIRNIGSFRAKRILEQVQRKKEPTLAKFIEPTTKTPGAEESPSITPPQEDPLGGGEHKETESQKTLSEKSEPINKVDQLIQELGYQKQLDILLTLHKRYSEHFNELKFICKTLTERTGRYAGQVTKDYLKKRVPAHLADENVSELFLRVKNEDVKNEVPEVEKLFTYKGTSIYLTDIGKIFYKLIRKLM